jgi:hypothetical protein
MCTHTCPIESCSDVYVSDACLVCLVCPGLSLHHMQRAPLHSSSSRSGVKFGETLAVPHCVYHCFHCPCTRISLQVHVRHMPAGSNSHLGQNWLADLTAAWKEAGLWITRAKVSELSVLPLDPRLALPGMLLMCNACHLWCPHMWSLIL